MNKATKKTLKGKKLKQYSIRYEVDVRFSRASFPSKDNSARLEEMMKADLTSHGWNVEQIKETMVDEL